MRGNIGNPTQAIRFAKGVLCVPGIRLLPVGGSACRWMPVLPRTRQGGIQAFAPTDPFNLRATGAELRRLRGLAIATCFMPVGWSGFRATEPDALAQTPEARATRERVISYLDDLHDESPSAACMAMPAASNGLSN